MGKNRHTSTEPALLMHYPGFVFRTLCEDGHAAAALLKGTGLTDDLLSDPTFRSGLPPVRRLILNALEQTGDPHLGIRLARRFEPSFSGLPAYAAMNAPDLRTALDVVTRFFPLSFPVLEFTFPDAGAALGPEEAALRLRPRLPLGDITYFSCMSALVASERLCRAILRADRFALRAQTRIGAPDGWGDVAGQIGFSIAFDADNDRIVFPAELLARRLPGADPINHRRLVALCEDFAGRAAVSATPTRQIEGLLRDRQRFDLPLSDVAAALGYSERGLRRHLARSGTSYRALVRAEREMRAREMLDHGTMPIGEIAHVLGFESASNFARSFKRWTGLTPSAYRDGR